MNQVHEKYENKCRIIIFVKSNKWNYKIKNKITKQKKAKLENEIVKIDITSTVHKNLNLEGNSPVDCTCQ